METTKPEIKGKNKVPTKPPPPKRPCTKPSCFFCAMKEAQPLIRRAKLSNLFTNLGLTDIRQDLVLALHTLWHLAMTRPDDPELPSLGIFHFTSKLIHRAVEDRAWLLRDQNVYFPYYAAHIIGSYCMNRKRLARLAVDAGVIRPLVELLKGKLSWVEQRVAVRALGHLASHETTFEDLTVHEAEIVQSAMEIARDCVQKVYREFFSIKRRKDRVSYHRYLLTKGAGGSELEDRKAEEWTSQLQCWSIYLLDCFARKERALDLICSPEFLKHLCRIWGGLMNPNSPTGIGLIRTLCNTKNGRAKISDSNEVIVFLCNTSRSSDEKWQFEAIDSILLLLKDPETRYKVMEISVQYLVDLLEIGRNRVGDAITRTILQDYHKIRYGNLRLKNKKAEEAINEAWELKVEKRKRETLMTAEETVDREGSARRLKRQGNYAFRKGKIKEAVEKYSEGLELCPLNMREQRLVLHSNRAQCFLLLGNPEAAISDATRAVSLGETGAAEKSLWRRSQAYDMMGLAKESLMDCLMFVRCRVRREKGRRQVAIPYYAARMISQQMSATWIFASVEKKIMGGTDLHLHERWLHAMLG